MSISVLVLTLNEEINIRACLDSLRWSDDLVVLDSLSTDNTVSIAQEAGARVYQRQFDNYAAQRNFGLRDIQYRHPWVLMVDADERVPADLHLELTRAVRDADEDITLFLMRRRDHLFGRWLKRSSGYPTWFGRLARVGHVWVERAINEEYCTSGKTARLLAHLNHYPFNNGFSAWITKHDRYSTMEAQLWSERAVERLGVAAMFGSDPLKRRRAIKRVVYTLPGRPILIFLALYILKAGFLDGRAGVTFSLLRSWYEYMIDCKRRELRRRREGMPI